DQPSADTDHRDRDWSNRHSPLAGESKGPQRSRPRRLRRLLHVVVLGGGTASLLWLVMWCPQVWREEVAAPLDRPETEVFFVSPHGNDRWSGKSAAPAEADGPFATVARAQQAVREYLKARKEPRRVRVELRGGVYYLDSPLEFGPEDSGTEKDPVVYAAAPG